VIEEEPEEPEPIKPIKTSTGKTVMPEPEEPEDKWITMSTKWKDERMKPHNVVKTTNFNSNWGQGEFTCIHTLNDKEGPWWKALFNKT